jgi:hypothetical protein
MALRTSFECGPARTVGNSPGVIFVFERRLDNREQNVL